MIALSKCKDDLVSSFFKICFFVIYNIHGVINRLSFNKQLFLTYKSKWESSQIRSDYSKSSAHSNIINFGISFTLFKLSNNESSIDSKMIKKVFSEFPRLKLKKYTKGKSKPNSNFILMDCFKIFLHSHFLVN